MHKHGKPARIESRSEYDLVIREAVRIPGDIRLEYDRAMALLAQGRLNDGTALLESVVASAPELTAPHVDLGIAYLNADRLEAAEKSLQYALVLTPGHPVAANELGIVYRRTGRFEMARRSFEAALESFPNYHVAQRNLGVLCDVFLGDLQCALENFSAYQQAYPDERQAQLWTADVERRLGQEGW
jgi:Flp pilus assembly protein TadD